MTAASASTPPRLLVAAAFAAVLLLVAGCSESPRLVERRLYSMGTWVDLAVVATPRAAEAVLDDAEALLRDFETDYYAWAADGELARLNRALARGAETTVSPAMAELLAEAKRLSAATGGAFDPGVGALVELYGFHDAAAGEPHAPSAADVDGWLAAGQRISAVEIDGVRISAAVPLLLDLGGIAKGEAVDRLVELFAGHGIGTGLVNAGGDLRVIGRPVERPWRIGIQNPRDEAVLGVIALEDGEAAFTSGDYERFVEVDGAHLHHILDPRTGRPAGDTRAVTVIARSGVLADAAATAIFVAGDDWREIAAALEIDAVLRVDANGAVEATEAMRRRLEAGASEQWDVFADS